MIGDAFAIAIVGYAINISLGKTFALKHGYKVDSNQVRNTHIYTCEYIKGHSQKHCGTHKQLWGLYLESLFLADSQLVMIATSVEKLFRSSRIEPHPDSRAINNSTDRFFLCIFVSRAQLISNKFISGILLQWITKAIHYFISDSDCSCHSVTEATTKIVLCHTNTVTSPTHFSVVSVSHLSSHKVQIIHFTLQLQFFIC